jgi:hypothetical protein
MPGQSSDKVIECLDKAAEARRLHDGEADPDQSLTYLHIELCWHRLANSYAFMAWLEASMKSANIH